MGNSIQNVSSMGSCGCNLASFSRSNCQHSIFTMKKKILSNNALNSIPLGNKSIDDQNQSYSNTSTVDPTSHFASNSSKSHSNNLMIINECPTRKMGAQDFILERTLGYGSVGCVLLVRKVGEPELLAMKVMKKAALQKDLLFENIILERHILQNNRHPFLVNLRHSFQSPTKLYFVMEYLSGGDLFSLIRQYERLLVYEAKFYAAEVILALEYLHEEMGIIYRDLKPENILISAEGHIKLTDFGLSKQAEKAYTFAGTTEYLAPEIFLGKGYTKAIDYWSLGVLIYEMLVGKPPFTCEKRNIHQIEKLILNNKPIYPSFLTKEEQDLIQKLLVLNPKKRLQPKEMKKHEFFKDINWEDLVNLKIKPPINTEKRRNRRQSISGESYLKEEENEKSFLYLPGISFNDMIE